MNGLHHWLELVTEEEIFLATGWCRDRAKETQHQVQPALDRAWVGIYEDNGSCIDIIEATPPELSRHLQVLKADPLTLTDGATFVEATLTSACANDVQARYPNKRIYSYHTVIALRKFAIRATPYGPKRSHLTLVIHSVDWLGDGRATEADTFKSVTRCEGVLSALRKLLKIRLAADCQSWLGDTEAEVVMSSNGNGQDQQLESQAHTQMSFGTQMVQPYPGRMDNDSLTLRTEQAISSRSGGTPKKDTRAVGPDPKDTKKAQLLSLLKFKGRQNVAPLAPPMVPVAATAPSAGGFTRTHTPNAPRDMAAPATTARTPALPGRPDHFRNEPLDTLHSESTTRPTDRREEEGLDIHMDTEPQPLPDLSFAIRNTSEALKGNSDDEPAWLRGFRPTCGSARVPAKQRSLLSKPESWAKPEAGHRFPDANIPIDILRAFREEHARMEESDAASSPISDDDDEELPDADPCDNIQDGVHADLDADEEQPTSQVSWSNSPEPEPPKRPGLPPDSSLENGKRTNSHRDRNQQINGSQNLELVIIESSNETADLPSSPPIVPPNLDSDEEMEMELEVPRGLGDSPANYTRISETISEHPASVVQVKDTPYAKARSSVSVPPPHEQKSSGESKESTTTSVVFCTYKDQQSSAEREAVRVAADTRLDMGMMSPTSRSKHVQTPFAELGDVHMEDVSLDTPQKHAPESSQQEAPRILSAHHNGVIAPPEPSPISAQRPPTDSTPAGETAPKSSPPKPSGPPETTAILPEVAKTKRKLENSPSKKSGRHLKRREIKIVGFGGDSPPRDIAAELRQARHDSLNRFREERRSTSVDVNPVSDERRSSVLQNRTVPSTKHRDAQAGAQIDQVGSAREVFEIGNQGSPENLRQLGRGQAPTANGGLPSASAALRRDPSPVEMDIDEPLEARAQNPAQITRSASRTSMDPTRALFTTSISRSESTHQNPKFGSTQQREAETIFQLFKQSYPEYSGSEKHFLGQCKQMYKLDLEDKMVPKWQWDDFIIRHRTDYKDYTAQCNEDGEDPDPYHRFYKDNIRDTLFTKEVIKNRKILLTALEELGGHVSAAVTPNTVMTPNTAMTAIKAATPTKTATPTKLATPLKAATPKEPPKAPTTTLVPVTPVPSPTAAPPKKPSRKSLPWGPSQTIASTNDRPNGTTSVDRPRHSLAGPPLRHTHFQTATSAAPAAEADRKRKHGSRSGTGTPLARASLGGSTSRHPIDRSKIPTEETGDVYRDFVFAWQRSTVLTGSIEATTEDPWPKNLSVRPKGEVPRPKGYDVLSWKDEL